MSQPDYVVVHCPKGHELQAATEHLAATLACPVCGIEFVPQAAGGPGSAPPAAMGTPPSSPTMLGYSGELLSQPVEYPSFTVWMLGLWGIGYVMQMGQVLVVAFLGQPAAMQPGQPPNVNMGVLAASGAIGCLSGLTLLVAMVLQLIWIHRIHKDAKRARQYNDVSPGLALGLSFVPIINYVWTAWTMRKLATFVDGSPQSDPAASQRNRAAISATGACLTAAIVVILTSCLSFGFMGNAAYQAFTNSMGPGGQFDQVQYQEEIQTAMPIWVQIIGPIVSVLAFFAYFSAVRKLEAALYPFLGAPPK